MLLGDLFGPMNMVVINDDHVIWCYMMLYDVIWCYMMLYDVIWCYMMLYDVIWCYMYWYIYIWHIWHTHIYIYVYVNHHYTYDMLHAFFVSPKYGTVNHCIFFWARVPREKQTKEQWQPDEHCVVTRTCQKILSRLCSHFFQAVTV